MKNALKIIKEVLLYVWQLPQNLAGLLVLLFCKTEYQYDYKTSKVYLTKSFGGGVSLGKYIFLSRTQLRKNEVVMHEYGHCIQSMILGPLYLLLGLCSIIHAMTWNCSKKPNKTYYDFFVEKCANTLGGVKVVWYGKNPCQYELVIDKEEVI